MKTRFKKKLTIDITKRLKRGMKNRCYLAELMLSTIFMKLVLGKTLIHMQNHFLKFSFLYNNQIHTSGPLAVRL